MPNLLAISFEGELTPSFDLLCLKPSGKRPDGWGLGYYPAGEPSAAVLKESAHGQGSELVKAWEQVESATFVMHLRAATWGSLSDANTQPFGRIWGGREWLFAHSGSLASQPPRRADGLFEPVGATDSELIFCELMNRISERKWRSLADVEPQQLRTWLHEFGALGTVNVVLTDGRDLCAFADPTGGGLFAWTLSPPYEQVVFGDEDVEVNLTRRGVKSRKGVVVCSRQLPFKLPLPPNPQWSPLPPGQLLIIRQGVVRAEVGPDGAAEAPRPTTTKSRMVRPAKAERRVYGITHRTTYRYQTPVERSTHQLRLVPMHDRLQNLMENEIRVSVGGLWRDWDDVFGNRVRRLLIDTPFTELDIVATSKVELLDVDPLSYRPLRGRSTVPLVWMPWQRQMLSPFLLPPELPESELHELTEYAMSFVERQDYDLLETLLDMNWTLFKEYAYVQGSTTLATTPFQTYGTRKGVCQDFTNLFICLARLLGVPARYTCGYVYTGGDHHNQRQGEASHAWAQVYLPEAGWKGLDPTNGVLTQTEHVRVSTGRSYVDATPTSGTLFVGGGPETLEVSVKVDRL